jgi:hypothetical protein
VTIKYGTCPYCKLVVRYDDEEKTIAHEVPDCAEFVARIARDFPRVHVRWLAVRWLAEKVEIEGSR